MSNLKKGKKAQRQIDQIAALLLALAVMFCTYMGYFKSFNENLAHFFSNTAIGLLITAFLAPFIRPIGRRSTWVIYILAAMAIGATISYLPWKNQTGDQPAPPKDPSFSEKQLEDPFLAHEYAQIASITEWLIANPSTLSHQEVKRYLRQHKIDPNAKVFIAGPAEEYMDEGGIAHYISSVRDGLRPPFTALEVTMAKAIDGFYQEINIITN